MTNIEILENRGNEIWETIKKLNHKYRNHVNDLLNKFYPNTLWFVDIFDKDRVRFSINLDETYPDGSFKKYSIELEHGYSSHYGIKDDDKFHLNINPFTAGTFTLLENNSLREYFGMVGNLCTNDEFRTVLVALLKQYYVEFKPIYDEYRSVEREITTIRRTIAEQEKLEKKNASYNEYKNGALTITDGYFVIDTGAACITNPDERIIYRKKPVKICVGPMSYDEAYAEMKHYYKSEYHKYKIVEVSKIKFTE